MNPVILCFENKNDTICATVPNEAQLALSSAAYCIPYFKHKKRGLLFCDASNYNTISQSLCAQEQGNPRSARALLGIAHRIEFDASGLLCLPNAAADFAQIQERTVLTQLAEGQFLLQAINPT